MLHVSRFPKNLRALSRFFCEQKICVATRSWWKEVTRREHQTSKATKHKFYRKNKKHCEHRQCSSLLVAQNFPRGVGRRPTKKNFYTSGEEKFCCEKKKTRRRYRCGSVFLRPKKCRRSEAEFFRDKVGKKSRQSPSSTDLVGRPQDAVGAGFEKSGTVGAQRPRKKKNRSSAADDTIRKSEWREKVGRTKCLSKIESLRLVTRKSYVGFSFRIRTE